MAYPKVDYTCGDIINNCVFIEYIPSERKHQQAKFHCHCGIEFNARISHVKNNHIKSCGCIRNKESARRKTTHGWSSSKARKSEYGIWASMKARCLNKNVAGYRQYGGRGIKVCDRWKNSFVNFIEDMGPRPSRKHSIERINVNGNYEPGNCKWATNFEQVNNKQNTVYLECMGRCKPVAYWARLLGVSDSLLRSRLNCGWKDYQIILTIKGEKRLVLNPEPKKLYDRRGNLISDTSLSKYLIV